MSEKKIFAIIILRGKNQAIMDTGNIAFSHLFSLYLFCVVCIFSVHIYMYVKCSKFLFLLSIKMLVFRTRTHKIVRIANRKDPDQTAS